MDKKMKGRSGQGPFSGRFQKGKSGNPNGRPKRTLATSCGADIQDTSVRARKREMLAKIVIAKTLEGQEAITLLDALVAKYGSIAMNGSRIAIERMLGWAEKEEYLRTEAAREISDHLASKKAFQAAMRDKAIAEGRPVQQLLPHPDDIVFDRINGVYTLIGPYDAEEVPYYAHWDAIRCLLLIWSEMARRRASASAETDSVRLMAYAQLIDNQLPPSYQWSEGGWLNAVMSLNRSSRKALMATQAQEIGRLRVERSDGPLLVALPERNITVLNQIAELLSAVFFATSQEATTGATMRQSDAIWKHR